MRELGPLARHKMKMVLTLLIGNLAVLVAQTTSTLHTPLIVPDSIIAETITTGTLSQSYGPNTNAVYVNTLCTGLGTASSPWTNVPTALNTNGIQYIWPSGIYDTTTTINLLGAGTHHLGQAGTVVRYWGSGVAMQAVNASSWTMNFSLQNFRIDCSNAVRAVQAPDSIVLTGSGLITAFATVTLTNHGYATGDIIDISGATQADYNGTRVVTVTSTNTFTYQLRGYCAPASPATTTTALSVRRSSVCLRMIGVRNQLLQNLSLANCSLGLEMEACVTGVNNNIKCTKYEEAGGAAGAWTVVPNHGLLMGKRIPSLSDGSTCQVFNNLVVEGVANWGVVIFEASNNSFIGGTSESNVNGVTVGGGNMNGIEVAADNTFIGWDTEVNSGTGNIGDWYIAAPRTKLVNTLIAGVGGLTIGPGESTIIGCYISSVVTNIANHTLFIGTRISSAAQVSDAFGARYINCQYASGAGPIDLANSWTYAQKALNNVGAGGTVNIDASLWNSYRVLYSGDFTLANPTNPTNSQRLILRMQHSSDANTYTITFGSAWNLGPVVAPTLNQNGKYSYLEAQYNSTSAKWDVLSWLDGY